MGTNILRTMAVCGAMAVAALGVGAASRMGPPGFCSGFFAGDEGAKVEEIFKSVKPEEMGDAIVKSLDMFPDHATTRMEILRRGVFGAEVKEERLVRTALHLMARAAAAEGDARPRALFDAGYFVGISGLLLDGELRKIGVEDGIAGYALVKRAIALKDDPEMHVGACFLTVPFMHGEAERAACEKLFAEHKKGALKVATGGTVSERVMKNLGMIVPQKELEGDGARVSAR